jgi:two-component system, response regulator PdtaR
MVQASTKVDNPGQIEHQIILIVEDEILLRMLIADEVRMHGFRVFEASNADDALAVLQTTPVDLVMTDIRMPGSMNGLRLAELARSSWPNLKIVIAAGQSGPALQMKDADAVFDKPYNPDRVVQRIKDLLKRSEQI